MMRVAMVMLVVRMVVMPVPVMMRPAEDLRANDIDNQTGCGNKDRFLIMNRLREKEAFDRAEYHEPGNGHQQYGTGKARQDFDLPSAKGEAGVSRIFSGGSIGKCRESSAGVPDRSNRQSHD